MEKKKDLVAKCAYDVMSGFMKLVGKGNKKELKEFYEGRRRYALEVVEKNIKLQVRERKNLAIHLHNANVYLGKY